MLRGRFRRAGWRAGAKLPNVEQLANEFGIARATVRQALALLAEEGLVSSRRGKGTFLIQEPLDQRWLTLGTDLASMLDIALDIEVVCLASEPSGALPAGVRSGRPAPAYQLVRQIHRREGIAYALAEILLDRRLHDLIGAETVRSRPVMTALATLPGVDIAGAHQTLTIETADVETAAHLGVPLGSPIVEGRRELQDSAGTIIYAGTLIYRGDLVKLEFSLTKR